ncbi:major vault protein-alpha [Dictyostelium purpureum]|uniref:Major vault protein-alpha n=1 Tax=Dictyostelium purpureum TaxID=5786 RepID=F0ZXL6_DICPU|nr:major vault protein-alpha [Dictyostelium purpureum]EGC31310.1 major vault protein-alpha [Dictyostelium purpureum]|eukprot:XP_003292154.1 major vault protein-alpha [Dictyostelium purpureum]
MADINSVIRIKPFHYIHVLDNNTNVTRVEVGPQTFTRQDHEKLVSGPDAMIMIPQRHYCTVSNPIVRDEKGSLVLDEYGQVKLRHGDEEIRHSQDPFPLYPGEKISGRVTPLQVVAPLKALRLRALRDFTDGKVTHVAGDEWLFEGPNTFIPRIEVRIEEEIKATIIGPNQALKLRANKACIDRSGSQRKAGEEWLVRQQGAYLPGVDEKVVEIVNAYILTDKKALHLKATKTFSDETKKPAVQRKAGEEWLVVSTDAETHIPDVYEQVVGEVHITTLSNRQYCVVLDPIGPNGKPQLGQKQLRKGEVAFFLNPGESLEGNKIHNIYVLTEQEALLLRAKETFSFDGESHLAGDRWMIYGPCDYVPPVQVEVLEKRHSIPLDENEGIYIRDIKTGKVSSIKGQSYMLKASEELWEKVLPRTVEEVLAKESLNPEFTENRDSTRVVTYRAPHNSAVQIYDYKEKKSRVVFGPDLVMLGPDEHFTVLSLSGDKPKRPHQIKAIALFLGPDFMTDVVIVETSDHARLSLKLSYNWEFKVDRTKIEDAQKIFQVPDFVGDSCKAIASRVRGAVAAVSFDDFHKRSAQVIRQSVFGTDENGEVRGNFSFNSNNLVITNIDIQSVEPVDQRTRDSLQKSVQLAIEITTKSQEAAARHEAEKLEQGARGRLERQKITDEAQSEMARKELLQLQAQSATVESSGQAIAEAQATAEAATIAAEANVKQAELKAQALKIRAESEINILKSQRENELNYKKSIDELEISKASELSEIEASKFKAMVDSIGREAIVSMAKAGPETQAKLLGSLNLKSVMITDGNSPVNLFNTANGLIGNNAPKKN